MSQTTHGALSPYSAIDLTAEIGALATMLLAGLGVDVIRVEPHGGHSSRRRGPMLHDDDDSSLYWAQMNAGKRSITLDLDDEADQEQLRQLCESTDFLFESDAPGAMASRGLGYADLRERAPKLIYVSITPFGQSGPKSMWAASDLIGHVSGGLSSLVGDPERAPLRPSVEQAYSITALNAGSAAMIALHARNLTNRGQHVDVAMQAAMANTLGNARLYWEMDGIITKRAGGARAFADRATRIIYPCADGYVAFVRVPASIHSLHRWMTAEHGDPQFDAEYWANMPIAGDRTPTSGRGRRARSGDRSLLRHSRRADVVRIGTAVQRHDLSRQHDAGHRRQPAARRSRLLHRGRRSGAGPSEDARRANEDVGHTLANTSRANAWTTQQRDPLLNKPNCRLKESEHDR